MWSLGRRPAPGVGDHASVRKEAYLARAYVKVNVAAGKEREVKDALLKRGEVRSADITSGDQDIIALVEADSFDALLDLTLNQLRTIEGVTGTVTNLIIDKEDM
jgi:DNA-binding Lrp family transcriptional regulator